MKEERLWFSCTERFGESRPQLPIKLDGAVDHLPVNKVLGDVVRRDVVVKSSLRLLLSLLKSKMALGPLLGRLALSSYCRCGVYMGIGIISKA